LHAAQGAEHHLLFLLQVSSYICWHLVHRALGAAVDAGNLLLLLKAGGAERLRVPCEHVFSQLLGQVCDWALAAALDAWQCLLFWHVPLRDPFFRTAGTFFFVLCVR